MSSPPTWLWMPGESRARPRLSRLRYAMIPGIVTLLLLFTQASSFAGLDFVSRADQASRNWIARHSGGSKSSSFSRAWINSIFLPDTTANSVTDLSVSVADNPDPITFAQSLTYAITVANNGPDSATGVTLTETLHATANFVSANVTAGNCSQSSGVVTCNIGNLANGATATATIVITPTVPGIINTIATITGNEIDSSGTNNSVSEQTRVSGSTNPSVVSATALNPPGLINPVGTSFSVDVVEATGLVYVGGSGDKVGVINPDSNTLIASVQLPTNGTLTYSRVNQTTNFIYFLQSGTTSNIAVIDGRPSLPTFNKALPTLQLTGQNVVSFDIDEVRGLMYATSTLTTNQDSSKISIIDVNPLSATFNQVVATVPFPAGAFAGGIAVNSTTNKIYTTASDTQPGVYVLDGNSLVLTKISNTFASRAVIVNASANLIYGGFGTSLYAIDGNNDTLLATIGLPANMATPHEGMTVNLTTGRIFIRGTTGFVFVVDGQRASPTFNTLRAQISVPDISRGIVVDELSNRVVVTAQNGLRSSIIDGATNTISATIPSPQLSSDVALNSTTHRAFIANQLNTVQKVNVGNATVEATIQVRIETFAGPVDTANHLFYMERTGVRGDLLFVDKDGTVGQVSGFPHDAGRYIFSASNSVTDRVYAVNSGANLAGDRFALPGFVSVVDGGTNSVIANVVVGNQPFGQIAVNQTTNKVYVTNAGLGAAFPGSIMVIDGVSNTKVDADISAFPANTGFSGNLVVNETANKVYFSVGGRLDVLNGANNVASILSPTGVIDFQVNNLLNRVYALVSNGSGIQVTVLDGSTNATINSVTIEPAAIGAVTMGLNQVTGKVFVADSGNNTITVVDGSSISIDTMITLSGAPRVVGVNELANHVYLNNTLNKTFSIFDGNNLSLRATVALPFGLGQIAVDQKGARIFAVSGTPDQAGVAVIAESTHSISGVVRDVSGNPLNGIAVNLSGTLSNSTNTNAAGAFSFDNLPEGGSFTVGASSANLSFSPPSQTFNNLTVDRIANFVGTQTTVSITGKVTDAGNVGMNNVPVALTTNGTAAGTLQTNGVGDYSFASLTAGANFVVTPVGTFTPSSQTLNNLTANAIANFKAAPSIPPQCSPVSFAAATNFAAGSDPTAVAIGDWNGDDQLDLAVTNQISATVSILLGSGTGSFSPATNFAVGSQPSSVAIGDFNADGNSDLAVANAVSATVSILLGSGTGSFGAATGFPIGGVPVSVAIGEFNGDGKSDLAVANQSSGNVGILLGSGTGSFSGVTTFAVGPGARSVVVGDFNGDGKSDLAVPNGGGNVGILLGSGTGTFGAATNFAAGNQPVFVAAADFNSDGKTDLAVSNQNSNNVSILLGTGGGSFSAATNFAVGGQPVFVAAGDFNGDGKNDLAVPNSNSSNVSVLLGSGTGSFSPATNFAVGLVPASVAIGDINGDGKNDLVVPNAGPDNISILLNNGSLCNTQSSLTISGQITAANNNALADVTVTLSGPITRVTSTDATGNYSFPNLVPGGNYTVTVQSNYFVFAPSRADFFNLSSSQTANFIAAPVAVPAPSPPPSDSFNSPTRDASKWSLGVQTESPIAFDPQVTVAQINGQLVITPVTQATGLHYGGYTSANAFDLRNGKVGVEVVKAATGGADTIFAIGSDGDNFYRFLVHTPGTPTRLAARAMGRDGIERPLDETVAQLIFQVLVSGQLTSISINYDPVLHRFMRFRHVPETNSIVFETSPNDIDYTVQHTVVLQKSVSALTAELSAGTSNPANPGSTVFDNFGLVTSTFQFSAGAYAVGESDGSVLITVTRIGSTANAASVHYATADGTAAQTNKYITAVGTLSFTAGQTSRTFAVLIVDNAFTEGNEALNLLLSNPTGSGLNSPGRAVLTIADNDTTVATGSPLDDAAFFVRQQYADFLNREPDQSGLNFWKNQITECQQPGATCSAEVRRINVSAAFFLSIEFQETGYLAYRMYKAAYGNLPGLPVPVKYGEFLPDTQQIGQGVIVNQTGWEQVLENNKVAFALDFVGRSRFTAGLPTTITPAHFVDALYLNAGVTPSATERTSVINEFGSATTTTDTAARGRALRRVAENSTLKQQETNRAFVLMQYFGYLRRNPNDPPDSDFGGYNFWLDKLNQFNGNFVNAEMVKAFIVAGEYIHRFGP